MNTFSAAASGERVGTCDESRPAHPAPRPEPFDAALRSQFPLDSEYTFLNHGSFGSCPRPVLAYQRRWQDIIEARPIEMLGRRSDEMLGDAKAVVGPFLGVNACDVAFVTNATDAINAIVRSLPFRAGDEILTTSHVYGAVRKSLRYVADRTGATVVEAKLGLPLTGPGDVTNCVAAHLSTRTKLVVIDHVTSPTALVFPVREIVDLCKSRGVDVLVDGAHAPGMLDLNIESIGATYYVGNLHKWTCAPKGAGFIWVSPAAQSRIHPTVISHQYGEGFAEEFSWQGTRDFSPWIAAAEAIRFLGEFGWDRIRSHNRAMAVWAQQLLCEMWDVRPLSPLDGSMLGSMVTVPLPEQEVVRSLGTFDKLAARLYRDDKIEVPVIDWSDRWFVRCSCQVYNTPEQYEKLGRAVLKIVDALKRGNAV